MSPDVLCIQETKLADKAFPHAQFSDLGYESAHHGAGQWNGVAIVSRVGLDDVRRGFAEPIEPDPDCRLIWATCNGVRIGSAYVPNGREVGHEHFVYKLSWMGRLLSDVSQEWEPAARLAVLGDFNIAPEDIDVWDPSELLGSTHVTAEERDCLGALNDWGLVDVFRVYHPEEGHYSWWDYRGGAFHRKRGMRIDLILATQCLVDRSTGIVIDRDARKGTKPSDHAPVVWDVDIDDI